MMKVGQRLRKGTLWGVDESLVFILPTKIVVNCFSSLTNNLNSNAIEIMHNILK